MSLQNAIFWGQYSHCEQFSRRLRGGKYGSECHHTHAMTSVCVFSVFMLISYVFQVILLLRFKDDLLGASALNEGYNPVQSVDGISEQLVQQQLQASAVRLVLSHRYMLS